MMPTAGVRKTHDLHRYSHPRQPSAALCSPHSKKRERRSALVPIGPAELKTGRICRAIRQFRRVHASSEGLMLTRQAILRISIGSFPIRAEHRPDVQAAARWIR